jgi:hypothetical protein
MRNVTQALTAIAVIMFCLTNNSCADVVDPGEAYARRGWTYTRGCSGFVADLLGRPWQHVLVAAIVQLL